MIFFLEGGRKKTWLGGEFDDWGGGV